MGIQLKIFNVDLLEFKYIDSPFKKIHFNIAWAFLHQKFFISYFRLELNICSPDGANSNNENIQCHMPNV